MKRKKLITVLILGLTLTLGFTTWRTVDKYKSELRKGFISENVVNQMVEVEKETIIETLNNENSLNVLSGDITKTITYDNKNLYSDDFMSEIWGKLRKREYTSTNSYSFMFSYSLKDLPIEVKDNIPYITLSYNRLDLTKCELISTDVSAEVGIFAGDFTPWEVNEINKRVKGACENDIRSDKEFRNKSMLNVQDNIRGLVGNNVIFIMSDYDVVEQDNYKTVSSDIN